MEQLQKSYFSKLSSDLLNGKKLKFYIQRGRTYSADITLRAHGNSYQILGNERYGKGSPTIINDELDEADALEWLQELCDDSSKDIIHYKYVNVKRHGKKHTQHA